MVIVLDTQSAAYSGDLFEEAVRVAASLAVSVVAGGFPLDLRTTDGRRETAGAGVGDGRRALDLLAAVRATPDDPGLTAMAGLDLIGSEDDGVSLTVVTGSAAGAAVQVLPGVRARFELITLVQVGPRAPGAAGVLRGVVAMPVKDSDEFAAAWVKVASR